MPRTSFIRSMYFSVLKKKCYNINYPSVWVPVFARTVTKTTKSFVDCEPTVVNNFMEMVENRRAQARSSLIIQVPTSDFVADVKTNCEKYGELSYFDYYSLPGKLDFVVVEFSKEECTKNVINDSAHVSDMNLVPVQSPFLWYRASTSSTKKVKSKSPQSIPSINKFSEVLNEAELINKIKNAESISDQILILNKETCLTDLGMRLRFLTLYQIELALSGLFPRIAAFPFGSSITGFGRQGCDLDIVINLDKDILLRNSSSRLVFHVKAAVLNGRASMQRHLESVGDIFQLFLPGISNMKRILQANVPIIKYTQDYTGLECDVSMNNMFAVNMSELLYNFCRIDSRVQPFVTIVHKWAYHSGLTHSTPGPWITNFSLTLLTIFFLQQTSIAVVPPAIKLTSGSSKNFVYNVNVDNLETLLTLFFDFYATFDFKNYAVNIVSGTPTLKPDNSPMYIVNPIETELNVSKNVSSVENEKFQTEIKNAYWLLNAEQIKVEKHNKDWGILSLFVSKRPRQESASHVKQMGPRKKNIVLSLWNDLQ